MSGGPEFNPAGAAGGAAGRWKEGPMLDPQLRPVLQGFLRGHGVLIFSNPHLPRPISVLSPPSVSGSALRMLKVA